MPNKVYDKLKFYGTLTLIFSIIELILTIICFGLSFVPSLNWTWIFVAFAHIPLIVMSILYLMNNGTFDKYTNQNHAYLIFGLLMMTFSFIVGIVVYIVTISYLKRYGRFGDIGDYELVLN